MKKMNPSILLPAAVMTALWGLVLLQTGFIEGSDDQWVSTALTTHENWMIICNNRVLVNVLAVLIEGGGVYVWRILSLTCGFLFFFYLQKYVCLLTGMEPDPYINLIFTGLFYLIPLPVLSSGVFWITGSFSNLFGVTGCLIFLWPFLCALFGKEVSGGQIAFSLVCGIYAGNLEQTSAVQLVFSSVVILFLRWKGRKLPKPLLCLWAAALFSFAILLLLPYNRSRLDASVAMYMPEFGSLSAAGKLFQGLVFLYSRLSNGPLLPLLLSAASACSVVRQDRKKLTKLLSLFPVWYYAVCLLVKMDVFYGHTVTWVCDFNIYHFHDITDYRYLIALLLQTLALSIEAFLIFVQCGTVEAGLAEFLFFGAGMASVAVMGFSPTMFASGNRTSTFLYVSLLLLIGDRVCRVMRCGSAEIKKYTAVFTVMLDLLLCWQFYKILRGIIIY